MIKKETNIIDLHSHILPKIDDGSHSIEESIEMLKKDAESGIKKTVFTPHFYADYDTPEEFFKRRKESFEKLQPYITEDIPEIFLGAEVAYFEGIRNCNKLEILSIGSTRLILIEMPNGRWTSRMLTDILYCTDNLNLTPVIAHIDRYSLSSEETKLIEEFIDRGGLVQANASAFLHFTSCSKVIRMITEGTVHFLGSDCHNMNTRPPKLGEAVEKIIKKAGNSPIDRIISVQNRFFTNL